MLGYLNTGVTLTCNWACDGPFGLERETMIEMDHLLEYLPWTVHLSV